ncbi:Hypothetical predicted protein [Olea europaea subsp. europaea]|uniref:Uncharacterized protein n=1 Tax=Olea europaea subsp. europaea TaxID=158383 RepID=A0A8S0UDW1_OLEEU|nr:Hypothetical predicted protein [Olea europaea subsp. europaea]
MHSLEKKWICREHGRGESEEKEMSDREKLDLQSPFVTFAVGDVVGIDFTLLSCRELSAVPDVSNVGQHILLRRQLLSLTGLQVSKREGRDDDGEMFYRRCQREKGETVMVKCSAVGG